MNILGGSAFSPTVAIHSMDDIRRLEKTPIDQAVTTNNTYDLFVNSAHTFGDKTALRFLKTARPGGETITWSYNELLRRINKTANLLHALGVGSDDAVSILLPGCLEYHLALWGGQAAGIANPLNPMQSEDNLIELMRASNTKVLIAYGEDTRAGYWTKTLNVMQAIPSLKTVLRVAPLDEQQSESKALPDEVLDFGEAMNDQPDDHLASGRQIGGDDVAAYFHTGGTTGSPKLAKHTHANQVFTAWAAVMLQGISHKDSIINGFPLFHVAGVLPGSLASLSAGVEVVIPTVGLMRNREVIKNYWKLVEYHKITVISAVPTVLAILATVPLQGADISSVRTCRTGAAPLPPELSARFKWLFGLHIGESWGMTEMAGISSISPPTVESPVGCVGFPLPFSRYKIVALGKDGKPGGGELPLGESGMILAKSPNVFPGYLDEVDTQQVFTADGWLITGDIGFVDTAGRIHLNGRSKDLIIRSAHNIDPRVIEDALDSHPAIDLCAAIGAPDDYAGELPIAFVTLKKDATVSAEELMIYAAGQVKETAAVPKWITIMDIMPTTNVGKIFKPELRRLAAVDAVARKAHLLLAEMSFESGFDVQASMDAKGKISVDVAITADFGVIHELSSELRKFPIPVHVGSAPE